MGLEALKAPHPDVLLVEALFELGAVLDSEAGEVVGRAGAVEVLGHRGGAAGGDVGEVLLHPPSKGARSLPDVARKTMLTTYKINDIYRVTEKSMYNKVRRIIKNV